MNAIPYAYTGGSLTLFVDDDVFSIANDHPNFSKILDAVRKQSWDAVSELINLSKVVVDFLSPTQRLKLVDGAVVFDGEVLTGSVIDHLFRLKNEGFDVTPLLAFIERLQDNPSYRVREDLFDWLQKGQMPITPDGFILAFKIVGADYKDLYSHTFDNSVGQVVAVDRRQVDDNIENTCSRGLHFCSRGYLPHYGTGSGSRVVIVKLDPADVVAFPRDYNLSKGRCSRYEVIGEVPRDQAEEALRGAVDGSWQTYDTVVVVPEPESYDVDESGNPVKVCDECGADNAIGNRYCTDCGSEL
jgi:hypothetical protein